MEIPLDVPLYRCDDCGFATTASQENASRAHEAGSPDCAGQIALIADFTRVPATAPAAGRRRRAAGRDPGLSGGRGSGALRGRR